MKEKIYQQEKMFFSPYAAFSKDTKGRLTPIEPCPIRTDYQRDRDRIIHSKAFRRLKHKTQVFLSPEGDHYRTRLTHTLEVSQIARTIARALGLNEDLCEAISLGHDIGHTPFGHSGEKTLNRLAPPFEHNEQSVRVVDFLEENGKGLNLTLEVRDGIKNHRLGGKPMTLEGVVVGYADRIAYVNHDIEDAIRAGIFSESRIPKHIALLLGTSKSQRIDRLITDIVTSSEGKPQVSASVEFDSALMELRSLMFSEVYNSPVAKAEESKSDMMLELIFGYYSDHPQKLPPFYGSLIPKWGVKRAVSDFIASMSDNFAVKTFGKIFIPDGWTV